MYHWEARIVALAKIEIGDRASHRAGSEGIRVLMDGWMDGDTVTVTEAVLQLVLRSGVMTQRNPDNY